MSETVIVEIDSAVGTIYLNEQESLNAISPALKQGLLNALIQLELDKNVKAIIIAGKGKVFSSGGDLRTMGKGISAVEMKRRMDQTNKIFQLMSQISKPIIAAVHGSAHGAGFSIALSTDIIIAENNVEFGLGFMRVGAIPDCGAHYYLTKALGPWKAKELVWTATPISAEEGLSYGFVNRLVDVGEAYNVAKELAVSLAEGPVATYESSKLIINEAVHQDLHTVLKFEGYGQAVMFQTEDHAEGINAFFEKRPPKFKGY